MAQHMVVAALVAVLSITNLLPVLGLIPAQDLKSPEEFVQAVLDRYGAGDSRLAVQDLQVLLKNASSCPGAQQQCPHGDDMCNYSCITAAKVLQIHNMSRDSKLNAAGLKEICPTLLYNVDRCRSSMEPTGDDDHDDDHGHGHGHNGSGEKPKPVEVWGFGIVAVCIISLCSAVGVLVVPFLKKRLYTLLLTFLVALAVGVLSGSALFHLIPHAFDLPHEEFPDKAAAVWAGLYLFFIIERLLKMASKRRQKMRAQKYAQQNTTGKYTDRRDVVTVCAVRARTLSNVDPAITEPPRHHHAKVNSMSFDNPNNGGTGEDGNADEIQQKSCCRALCSNTDAIATVAWMVIFGDGLHNLMDGLAIGASFQVSVFSGLSTSLAILCEEFPHELGDFAILLNAGMSVRQALFYNFLSACCCFVGLFIGILVGEDHSVGQWIFGLAAGMFLYISLVDMMPQMNALDEDEEKSEAKQQDGSQKSSSLLRFFLQNLGLLTGFTIMLLLSKFHLEL